MRLPITNANLQEWFPAPAVENPMAGSAWWQVQSLGLLLASQLMRLIPDVDARQQALVELRRALDTALLTVPAPTDEEVRRRMAQTLAPWCPSPFDVVEAMLDLAEVKPREYVLDLGSGDGRIVFAAARRGAYARGIEIDARFVAEANERAEEHLALSVLTEFQQGQIETADWGYPDVVTCYLLSSSMAALQERFRALRPGTRIISHAFEMPGWVPTRSIRTSAGLGPIHLWVV